MYATNCAWYKKRCYCNEYRHKNVRKNVENVDNLDNVAKKTNSDYHYVEQNIDHDIFKDALYQELKNIGADHRSTFILRHQQNFSIKEISEIMNCSTGTVKSRLFYTVKKLAKNLKDFNPY